MTIGGVADPFAVAAGREDGTRDADIGYAAGMQGTTLRAGRREVIWSVPTTAPLVAFTFDDGPHPAFTPRILAALQKARVTATFNVMGLQARRHPALLAEVVAAGHEIGNHTHTHADLTALDKAQTLTEIRDTQDQLQQLVQQPVRLFRPPRGELTGFGLRAAAELQLDVVMWSLDRGPGGVGTPQRVAQHVGAGARRGDIVALHDGLGHAGLRPDSPEAKVLARRRNIEVHALPRMLELVAANGLQVVPVSTLLRS
jgi:peptidoglycan/xylan/chitin deacetylase (PgdA/CDA1 family)